MKILHTADLHLGSPLSARMTREGARERGGELLGTLARLIGEARRVGAKIIIIAGDLFDLKYPPKSISEAVRGVIAEAKDIAFFICEGNHDEGTLELTGIGGLTNVYSFGKDWSYYSVGDGITVGGCSAAGRGVLGKCSFDEGKINIAVLHGDLRERGSGEWDIDAREAVGRGIDYIALGHYHSYRHARLDRRTAAVYCGTPEGRGFDECGEKGYVLIEIEGGAVTHGFVPFAKRRLTKVTLPLDGICGTADLMERARLALRDVPREDMVRLELCGSYEPGLGRDIPSMEAVLSEGRYYLEVTDSSAPAINTEALLADRSVKGELARAVMGDGKLDGRLKREVIACALAALCGEDYDGPSSEAL